MHCAPDSLSMFHSRKLEGIRLERGGS